MDEDFARRHEDSVIWLEAARPSLHAIQIFASHHSDDRLHLRVSWVADLRTDVSSLPQRTADRLLQPSTLGERGASYLRLIESKMSRCMLCSMLATSRPSSPVGARRTPGSESQFFFTLRPELGAVRTCGEAQCPDVRVGMSQMDLPGWIWDGVLLRIKRH